MAAAAHDSAFELRLTEARAREIQTLTHRERLTRGAFAVGFVTAAVALVVLAPTSRHSPWWVYAAFGLAYAAAWRIRFEVATGVAIPTVVVLVPALFLLPARTLPIVVLASVLGGATVEAVLARRPVGRAALVAAASSWFCLGPALVFVFAGEPAPTAIGAAVAAAAVMAQLAFDAVASTSGEWLALGIHPREIWRPLRDAFTIDLLLVPIGFFTAMLERVEIWAVVMPVPFLVLLILFARERRKRLDRVLDLVAEVRAQHATTEQALDRSVAAERALRETDAQFRQLAEAIPEVFFLFGLDHAQTLFVSPTYEAVWGRPLSTALGPVDAWHEGIHADDLHRVRDDLRDASQRSVESSFRVVRPDGEIRWVVQQLFPVRNADGAVFRIAGVARDLSDLKTLEDQLRQSQKMEAIGQLAGGVAHDFNNLLTVIKGYAELATPRADEGIRSDLREISDAADRAAGLTGQILAFSRRQVMKPEVIDLNDVVREASALLNRLIDERVTVRLELADDAGSILADAGQIGQVVMNLAINARDAMPNGGILTIGTTSVKLDAHAAAAWDLSAGEHAKLVVADSGTGMDAETQRRIFEPFYTTKEPGKGTGLGLSTCYGIAKQSGGHIDVVSRLGAGTTFSLYFPLTQNTPAVDDGEGAHEPEDQVEATLLLVEDNPSVRALTERMLKTAGYTVRAVASPTLAIAAWTAEGPFDALVTDLAMPGMTGRELVRRLVEDGASPSVVYMSGYSGPAQDGALPGRNTFLQKPFSSSELAGAVREVLGH